MWCPWPLFLASSFTYPSRDGAGRLPPCPCPSPANPRPHCHRNVRPLEQEAAPRLRNKGGRCIWNLLSYSHTNIPCYWNRYLDVFCQVHMLTEGEAQRRLFHFILRLFSFSLHRAPDIRGNGVPAHPLGDISNFKNRKLREGFLPPFNKKFLIC